MARKRRFKPPKVTTVIGQGTEIKGHVTFSGGLHLDGKVQGNVTGVPDSNSTLTISERGIVEGDVRLDNLILNGEVQGDVYASQRVELASAARVAGTVHYQLLEMAMGAEVNGQLVHSEEQMQRQLAYDRTADNANAAHSPDHRAEEVKS
jgi:cytoskeletal protein CcmA (bactofilin family)